MKTTIILIGYILVFMGYEFIVLGTTEEVPEVRNFSRVLLILLTLGVALISIPKLWKDVLNHIGGGGEN